MVCIAKDVCKQKLFPNIGEEKWNLFRKVKSVATVGHRWQKF